MTARWAEELAMAYLRQQAVRDGYDGPMGAIAARESKWLAAEFEQVAAEERERCLNDCRAVLLYTGRFAGDDLETGFHEFGTGAKRCIERIEDRARGGEREEARE